MAGCGRKASRRDAAISDAPDAAAECATVFDRFHASIAGYLGQLGLHESANEARFRDRGGIQACMVLMPQTLTCLLNTPVGPAAWATCHAEPMFALFDATSAHEALLGDALGPEKLAAALNAISGKWYEPARGLDDAIEWTIGPDSSLSVRRTNNGKSHDDPIRQLTFARERLLALRNGPSTQFAPMFISGDKLFISWTSGAMAIPMSSKDHIVLDLASKGRWVVYADHACTIIDPARGATPASCTWEGDAFVVRGDGLSQSWQLLDGFLVHPEMERFTRQGK